MNCARSKGTTKVYEIDPKGDGGGGRLNSHIISKVASRMSKKFCFWEDQIQKIS